MHTYKKLLFLLSLFVINRESTAAPPIMELITVVDPEVDFFFKDGHFLVLNKKASVAIFPLISILPTDIPIDLSSWTKIPKSCQPSPTIHPSLDIRITQPKHGHLIQVYKDGTLKAETTWLSSPTICRVILHDIDKVNGPELILLHQQREDLFGVTIFRLPESAQY